MGITHVRHTLVAMVVVLGLIGLAFIGLAFGYSLKVGDLSMLDQHPLFSSGVESLSSSVVIALFLLGFGRSSANA